MIHIHTPKTKNANAWLDEKFPEGDVVIEHTQSCDLSSFGDECQGGCPVVDAHDDEQVCLVCRQCGASFGEMKDALGHAGTCGSNQGFDVEVVAG